MLRSLFGRRPRNEATATDELKDKINLMFVCEPTFNATRTEDLVQDCLREFDDLFPGIRTRGWTVNIQANSGEAIIDTTVRCRDIEHATEMQREMDGMLAERGLMKK